MTEIVMEPSFFWEGGGGGGRGGRVVVNVAVMLPPLMEGMFSRKNHRYQQHLCEPAVLETLEKRKGASYIVLYTQTRGKTDIPQCITLRVRRQAHS